MSVSSSRLVSGQHSPAARPNVAVALSTLGRNAAFVTVLPENNPLADAAVGELRSLGVDTSKLVRGPGRMGIYFLETGANQRSSRVLYDRAGSSAAMASPGSIDWDKDSARGGLVPRYRDYPGYQRNRRPRWLSKA